MAHKDQYMRLCLLEEYLMKKIFHFYQVLANIFPVMVKTALFESAPSVRLC